MIVLCRGRVNEWVDDPVCRTSLLAESTSDDSEAVGQSRRLGAAPRDPDLLSHVIGWAISCQFAGRYLEGEGS